MKLWQYYLCYCCGCCCFGFVSTNVRIVQQQAVVTTNSSLDVKQTSYLTPNFALSHEDVNSNEFRKHIHSPNNSLQHYCEPEVFQHDYISSGNVTQPMTNHWKRARIGERVGLHDVCLKSNGLPLTRWCRFNYQNRTAQWESIAHWPRISCLRQTREIIISGRLNTLHDDILTGTRLRKGFEDRREVTKQLCNMLDEPNYRMLPADVHFTSQILKRISEDGKDAELAPEVLSICSKMMSSDPQVLRLSGDLNATNTLLETFETYMDEMSATLLPHDRCNLSFSTTPTVSSNQQIKSVETIEFAHLGARAHLTSNVSVFFINPDCTSISGIAVYALKKSFTSNPLLHKSQGNFLYRFVYANESTNALMQENGLEVATYLPMSLLQQVKANLAARGKPLVLVLKVYAHDALFVEEGPVQKRKPFSKILSISIPGYDARFPEVLPFILRHRTSLTPTAVSVNKAGTGCGYWNYSTWVSDNMQTIVTDSEDAAVILCGTYHLTQFSYLVGGSYQQGDSRNEILINPAHEHALDIISVVGCSLSLLGLCGIWFTAALFQKWRTLASTKVLLHLCVALTLQMVIFVFINTDDMSEYLVDERFYVNCIALGAVMQYSILVLFSWMLIIALLQFQRYVTVIGIERPRHYILKSAILAWGFPLLPTLLVVFIDPDSYIPTEYQLITDTGVCYPSGYALTFGVVLPVSIIVIANLFIFIYVFYSISHTLNQAVQRNEKKMIMKQIRLSVLLFFLLGLSWIFGLFAFMRAGIAFSYLFCLTATLQGLVLFVFFVLLDEIPRTAWLDLLCPSRKVKTDKRATEVISMNTTSTGMSNGDAH